MSGKEDIIKFIVKTVHQQASKNNTSTVGFNYVK